MKVSQGHLASILASILNNLKIAKNKVVLHIDQSFELYLSDIQMIDPLNLIL